MRSNLSPSDFFFKMKKKPELQKVLDNIDAMTIEEINNLSGSQFPKWIREHLVALKRNGGTDDKEASYQRALEIAAKMVDYSNSNK